MTKPSELAAVHADVAAAAAKLKADQRIADCLEAVKRDADLTLKDQIALTEIESPPFHETVRGQDLMRRLKELGLTEVSMDSEGNVIGIRRGTLKGEGPHLVLAAHQDTVFPAGTDVKVRIDENGVCHAPGISDDAAVLRSFFRCCAPCRKRKLRPSATSISPARSVKKATGI